MTDNDGENARAWDLSPSWGIPQIRLIKSDGHPWSLIFWFHTDESVREHDHTFTWMMAFKTAWPPFVFYRGWIQWR